MLQHMKNGQVAGKSTNVVTAVLNLAKLEFDIKMYPWARALSIVNNNPNVLIYSLVRTPEREKNFKWVGELLATDYHFYRLKHRRDIAAKTIEDMRQYSIGVVRSSVIDQTLTTNDFSNLNIVANIDINIKKLQQGRLDFIVHQPGYFERLCQRNGIDSNLFEAVMPFSYVNQALYMAYSKSTDDKIVNQTRLAYQQLKEQGVVDKMMKFDPVTQLK